MYTVPETEARNSHSQHEARGTPSLHTASTLFEHACYVHEHMMCKHEPATAQTERKTNSTRIVSRGLCPALPACYPASVYAERNTRDAQRSRPSSATAPRRTHMRCLMHLGLRSPSIASIPIQLSVTGGGRGRDSRHETCRAQAQVFPGAMVSAMQIQACEYICGKENSGALQLHAQLGNGTSAGQPAARAASSDTRRLHCFRNPSQPAACEVCDFRSFSS